MSERKTKRKNTGRSHSTSSVVHIASKGRVMAKVKDAIGAKPAGATQSSHKDNHTTRLMISVSGIRGVIGRGLTPEVVAKYAAAFGTWCNGGTIVVGTDSRVSGPMVKGAVVAALMATGCKVVDIGVVPTPTIEIAVKDMHAHGGIAVTASHNPVEWNALKLIGPGGLFLSQSQMNEVLEMADGGTIDYTSWDRLGKHTYFDNAVQNHIEHVLALQVLEVERIRERAFRVAVDCINGAGGVIVPKLLRSLGCEVYIINEEPHGIFAHNPEPVPANLEALARIVAEKKCDVGFALDPDVDRLALVSEEGKAIGEEYTLAMATELILSKKKSPVVVNASTSAMVSDIASSHGVDCYRTKIGEINVTSRMKEVGAVIGGEGNGGVILPDVHYGRDAVTATALVLQLMADRKMSLGEVRRSMPSYIMKKDKIELRNLNADNVLESLVRDNRSAKIDTTDGVRIDYGDSWIHFRKSNTEPILRIIAEARNKEKLQSLLASFTRYVK